LSEKLGKSNSCRLFVGVDCDVGDVERDRGLALVGGPVWAAPMDPTMGREDEPSEGLWLILILGDENVAVDFHGVVHPPLHEIGVVVEDLLRAVRRDRSWERDVQTPPGLPVLLPRLELSRLNTGIGEQKPNVTIQAGQIEGVLEVVVQGGSGGAGGAGGASGAVARFAPKCPARTGAGGRGGAAGAGSTVVIYYGGLAPGSTIIPQTAAGTPGLGGAGSPPGAPGAAGTSSQVEVMQAAP
jgi:hypothetical protein